MTRRPFVLVPVGALTLVGLPLCTILPPATSPLGVSTQQT